MRLHVILLALLFTSCYPKIEIEGFDAERWNTPITECSQTKTDLAALIISQEDQILGKGQAEVKELLGQPDEHELYRRNQKFFYYNLTAQDSCSSVAKKRLSILFDALDRAKEVMIAE
jgi:hypothetical protein